MTDPISKELFTHLAKLAAFELDEAESEYLRSQLNHQLKAVKELEEIPLQEEIEISPYGLQFTPEISAAPRLDTWEPFLTPEQILTQAPETEDGYFVVPEIPHTELS